MKRYGGTRGPGVDFVVARGGLSYSIVVKVGSEGRSDRLVPLWSQAWLQARHAAEEDEQPLAIVAAPRIPWRAAEQVLEFASEFVPGAAAGVVDFSGLRAFRGPKLDELNGEIVQRPSGTARRVSQPPANIFSDLNQWMLKVLLAPELPEEMLSAPRDRYRNASQLARAAEVSVMSASRLVRQLQHDGFLHESSAFLELVRREELFRRWKASAARLPREAGFRYVLGGAAHQRLGGEVKSIGGCLGLYAAADALGLGFVDGVPPHVYVRPPAPGIIPSWPNLVPAAPNEAPDLFLRIAAAEHSVFRGAVQRDSVSVSDVLQVWLDVSNHPARGNEQADLIRGKVLDSLIGGAR